jgi:hypothetical protein
MTVMIDSDHAALVAELEEHRRTIARRLCAHLAELEPIVVELVDVDARLRATRHRAGIYHDPSPPVRELAVEVLGGAVQALFPYAPMVSHEAAALAEAQLTGTPAPTASTGGTP